MLPIAKYPKFLSPSSLSQYKNMPITFYLTRMAPDPIKIVSDTKATSLGTAIDGEVKLHICNQFGWTEKIRERILNDIFDPLQRTRCETLSLERLLFENIPKSDAEIMALGRAIGRWYINSPMYASLDIVDIEYHPKFNITYDGKKSVPIYCKLDATVRIPFNGGKCLIPLDIKSTSGSPAQGYMMLYDPKESEMKKHKIFRDDITFKEINETWDNQLLVYHMALKHEMTRADVDAVSIPTGLPAMIEQICVGNSIRVARFMASCGSAATLHTEFSAMWSDIHDGTFTNSLIDNRMLLEYFASKEHFY